LNITIVSYTFPPSNEIGGRRWAKFSIYLAKLGHNVTVVCAEHGGDKEWYEHEFKGIQIVTLPKLYPEWLYGGNLNFQQKIYYFIQSKVYKLFLKNNLFDRAKKWKKPLLERLEKIHKENPIDYLVTSGGPFSILYFGTLFKQKYSNVKLISDFVFERLFLFFKDPLREKLTLKRRPKSETNILRESTKTSTKLTKKSIKLTKKSIKRTKKSIKPTKKSTKSTKMW
jgi:hypothetical protein